MFHKIFHTALLFLVLATVTPALSQTDDEESLRKSASELFENELYEEAFALYSQLLSLRLESSDYNYHFGACQLFYGHNKEKALQYLKFATEQKEVPALAYFYYGLGLHLNYRFDKAIDYYQKYKELASKKDRELEQVDNYLNQCRNGKLLVSNFTDIKVLQREVLPVNNFYRNYDLSEFGGKIIVKPEEFMSDEDRKRDANFLMYFQKDADLIYYGSYSDKNQTGKDLYFISKLPTGGWSKAAKLDDVINTEFDEDFPFIHPGGNTLYFASKGHNSMGGYDIFKSTRNGDGSWTRPKNMEFAINTPWDDYMFISDKEEKTAWFSSNRETSGKEVTVYKIGISRIQLDLTLIKGSFESEGSKKATITIEDMVQNKKLGVFESEGKDGGYLIDLKGSGKYKFIVEAVESSKIHTGIVEVPRQKGLKQFSQEMKLVIVNGEEQLQIINHFDTPLEGESLVTADILKKQASLKVNSDESDIESTPKPVVSLDPIESIKSKPQRLSEAKNKLAELEGDAELMKQKATYLFNKSKEKSNSSDPQEIAEAAIALELANLYIDEADKRAEAAKTMSTKIQLVENGSLSDDAFNAQINQAKTIGENFENLESFESNIPTLIEKRVAFKVDAYNTQVATLGELKDDLKSIDDEIEYLKAELENTKDKDLKAEYQFQIEDAQKAIPVKKEALKNAELKVAELEAAKNNASSYVSVSEKLLEKADEEGENTPATITAKEIATAKDRIIEKAKTNDALFAILSPNAEPSLANSDRNAPTKETVDQKDQSSEKVRENETVELANNNSTNSESEVITQENAQEEQEEITDTNSEVDNNTESNATEPSSTTTETIAENEANESSEVPEIMENNEVASTEEPEPEDINDAIREIEANESSPDIVNGDYNSYFQEQIAQASQAEDPMIAESRKAELYDQWTDNINYRIDSIDQKIETLDDTDKKLALVGEVEKLKSELLEKEDLSMASYQAIADLSDAQAGDFESNSSQSNTQPAEQATEEREESVSLENTSEPLNELDAINIKYKQQLTEAQSITESLERKTAEAAVNKAWSSELEDHISVLNTQIDEATDPTEKANIEKQLASAEKTQEEKERKFETLQKQAQAIASGENEQVSQQEFDAKLEEYIENYDRQAFVRLEGNVNINPDENQRLVQTNSLTRNWMISLRNEIIKTEARKRKTTDPKQIAQINERLFELEKDKIEVQAKLDSLDANSDLDAPRASANVLVKGSERFEGYENVIDNQTVEQLDENVEEKTESYTNLAERVEEIRAATNNDPKKNELAQLEEQLADAENNLDFAEIDKESAIREKKVINNVESELLQMTDGQDTPAEREQKIASEKMERAEQKLATAQSAKNEAQAIKKKSERETAVVEADQQLAEARLMMHEADLAESLAERTLAIEEKAIAENFIIPRGKEALLPVVNRTLNPNEEADIKATSEFQTHDAELRKVAALIQEAVALEQQEITLQAQAQEKLNEVTASSPAERAVQTKEAYDIFEKADNISAQRAIKIRQAAFIENEANKELLSRPEEVYMNVLAYYNTVGQPTTTASMLAQGGGAPLTTEITGNNVSVPQNDLANVNTTADGASNAVNGSQNNSGNNFNNESETATNNGTDSQNGLTDANSTNGESNAANGSQNNSGNNFNNESETATNNGTDSENGFTDANSTNGESNAANGSQNNSGNNFNNESETAANNGTDSQNGLTDANSANGESNAVNGSQNNSSNNFNNESQTAANNGTDSQNGLANSNTGNNGSNANNGSPSNRNTATNNASNITDEPFNLLPPTNNVNQNNSINNTSAGETPGRIKVSEDILTSTIFDLAPDASNNISGTNSQSSSGGSQAIPIDPVMPAGVVYKIQLGAFSKPIDASRFKGIKPIVGERTSSGYIRYTAGQFPNFVSADAAKDELRQIGFPDAFVVAYQNGVRANVEQAKQYEGKSAGQVPTPATPGAIASNRNASNTNTTRNNSGNNAPSGLITRGPLKITDVTAQDKVFYTVQVGVYGRKVTSAEVYNITPLNEERMSNGNYRYSTGVYDNFTTADQAKQEARKIGIADAFVVAYRTGSRISVADARTELNDQSPAYTGFAAPIASNIPAENNTPAQPVATTSPVVSNPQTQTPNATEESGEAKYTVFIGRYNGEVPIEVASVLLSISDQVTKKKDVLGSSYFYGAFVTEQEAKAEAQRLQNLGLTNAKADRLK